MAPMLYEMCILANSLSHCFIVILYLVRYFVQIKAPNFKSIYLSQRWLGIPSFNVYISADSYYGANEL